MSPRLARLALAAVLVGAACGDDDEPAAPPAPSDATVAALCDAVRAARDGDLDEAEDIVLGRAHDRLHELAAEVSDLDRTVAAALLEAKQRVEADLTNPSDELQRHLEDLVAATADAVAAAGRPRPDPCTP